MASDLDRLIYLCENGAVVIKDDRAIIKREFPWDLAMEVSHAVLEREDCEVLISGERTSYIIPKHDSYRRLLVETVKNDVVVVREPEEIPEPIVKVSFYTDPKDRDIAGKALGGQFAGRLSEVVSGLEWIDFTLPGSGKGSALAELGKNFGYEYWERVDKTHSGVRFCASWATTQEHVDALRAAVQALRK